MIFSIPKFNERFANSGFITREWYRWLSIVWSNLGYSKDLPIYKHVFVDANAMDYDGENVSKTTISGDTEGVTFPKNEKNKGCFNVRMPENYKLNSDINAFILYYSLADIGNVIWTLSSFLIADTETGSISTGSITDSVIGYISKVKKTNILKITNGVDARNKTMVCSIARNGNDANDTLENGAILIGILFVFQVEGIGTND